MVVLGPERPDPMLPAVLERHGIRGPVALISAGWRQDEPRDEPLRAALPMAIHNLNLYQAFIEVERLSPDLTSAYTRKQAALQSRRALYNDAIRAALSGCQKLWSARRDPGCPWFLQAVRHLQAVDALWLEEADRLHRQFEEEARPLRDRIVRAEMARMLDILRGCEAVLIAGGHVGVLRNRLFFFGMDRLLQGRRIFAWSGGAMVLCPRIVLYHDFTPYGVVAPEILDRGLDLCPDTVFLAHARTRLNMDDRDSLTVLRARLAPARVIGLENGAVLEGANLASTGRPEAAFYLQADGTPLPAPAPGAGHGG